MVSSDGKAWERRSRIGLGSFAVDPDDAEHVVATTEAGLVASTDGGRAWQLIAGPDGAVHRCVDKGSTGEPQGRLSGTPEALLVDGAGLYAAVSEEGIFRSDDGGRTWQLRYRAPS